ncbi:MAG TPA: class I SAM-dependent methyltransferase [Patescibacteria group bacterium]|nr:class I SAM-dependent methyltransferase [Patescibacteria group bacterium]
MEAVANQERPAVEYGLDERRDRFLEEIQDNSVNNRLDPRINSFSSAVMLEYGATSAFRELLDSSLLARSDVEQPSLQANILLRSIQKQLLRRENKYPKQFPYPEPYESVLAWRKDIRALSVSDTTERAELIHDLSTRYPLSNIVERYKAFSLITQLMRGRFDRRPNIIDVGCSQNLGLKKLALKPMESDKPWQPAVSFGSFGEVVVTGGSKQRNQDRSDTINKLLRYNRAIGNSVGIDIEPIDDPDVKEFARACSFYPSELLPAQPTKPLVAELDNPPPVDQAAEYDFLDSLNPDQPKISFFQGDFTNLDTAELTKKTGVSSADMVTISTVLDQVSQEARDSMLATARRLVKPHGLIVVQDFVHALSPTELEFYDNWFEQPYRYRTLISDGESSFTEFHELFRWYNGRCKRLQLGRAISRLAISEGLGLAA